MGRFTRSLAEPEALLPKLQLADNFRVARENEAALRRTLARL